MPKGYKEIDSDLRIIYLLISKNYSTTHLITVSTWNYVWNGQRNQMYREDENCTTKNKNIQFETNARPNSFELDLDEISPLFRWFLCDRTQTTSLILDCADNGQLPLEEVGCEFSGRDRLRSFWVLSSRFLTVYPIIEKSLLSGQLLYRFCKRR